MEKFEAKMMAKMDAWLEKIKTYLEEVKAEIDADREGAKACPDRSKLRRNRARSGAPRST
jgi:hypothetical protein